VRLVDLAHPLVDGGPGFPGDPPFSVFPWAEIGTDGYRVSKIEIGSHQGTHLDAPAHFLNEALTVEQMPLEWFYGPAQVLRIPKGPGEEIGLVDLEPYARHGFAGEAKLLLATGWDRRYGTEAFYKEAPSLTVEACEYLVDGGIRLLGMDLPTPSLHAKASHLTFFDAGVVLVESLANLDTLPDEVVFCAFPLKLVGGDGSPVRAVAICP
jgi:arylformamidase